MQLACQVNECKSNLKKYIEIFSKIWWGEIFVRKFWRPSDIRRLLHFKMLARSGKAGMTCGHFINIPTPANRLAEYFAKDQWEVRKGSVCVMYPALLHHWLCYWCQLLPALRWFHFPSRYKVISTHWHSDAFQIKTILYENSHLEMNLKEFSAYLFIIEYIWNSFGF